MIQMRHPAALALGPHPYRPDGGRESFDGRETSETPEGERA